MWVNLASFAALAISTSPLAAQTPLSAPRVVTVDALAAASRADPGNADVLRRLAAGQAAAGQMRQALATIDRAYAIAPDDLDIRLARARILYWSGRSEDAGKEADAVAAIDAHYPELAELRKALTASATAVRTPRAGLAASIGVASVSLAGGEQTWTNFGVTGFAPVGARAMLSANVDVDRRRETDARFALRLDRRIPAGEIYVAISATPNANFRERMGVAGGLILRVAKGVTSTFDLRHARYANVSVSVLEPGVRFTLPSKKLILSARWINLFQNGSGHRSGVATRGDLQIGNDHVLFAGAATYPDTEAGITRQVRAAYAGAVIAASKQLSFRLTGDYENRVVSYTRRGVTIGLIWRPER